MRRVVLEANRQLLVAERDPAALATPAAVDQPRMHRQKIADRSAGFGCVGFPPGSKVEITHSDRQVCHGAQRSEARKRSAPAEVEHLDDQPTISTHILDTERGIPAQGVEVVLFHVTPGGDREVGRDRTDKDGRIKRLLDTTLERGSYRIEFRADGSFFVSVTMVFRVTDPSRSYHVPLLMAPYSIASYRGS
jgi:5-hydroxyisourate hydrolase